MRDKIRLVSSAGTGHFYTTDKNKRLMPEKFEIKKYALSRIGEASRAGGLIAGTLSFFASLALFRGLFHLGF